MQAEVRVLLADEYNRVFVAASPEQIQNFAGHNHHFWTTRGLSTPTPEQRADIIEQQSFEDSFFSEGCTAYLREMTARNQDGPAFSILEIGAANGTLLKKLGLQERPGNVRYLGFECLPILCEDFAETFPGQRIVCGDINDFMDHEFAADDLPFSLFYSAVTFIMIPPEDVLNAFRKLGNLVDEILIFDFVEWPELHFEAGEAPVIYLSNRNVFWFLHDFAAYLDEIGFEIVHRDAPRPGAHDLDTNSPYQQYRGMGFIHAKRR